MAEHDTRPTAGSPRREAEAAARPDSQRRYTAALAQILAQVSEEGGATIAELAETVGVSRPTVQRALDELGELGLIEEAEQRASGAGRPARRWIPRDGIQPVVMALDIRHDESRLVLSSLTGHALVDARFSHRELLEGVPAKDSVGSAAPAGTTGTTDSADPDAHELPELVLHRVEALLAEAGLSGADVVEAIIGVSGIVADDGGILLSAYVPGLTGYALRRRAAEIIGLHSVRVENDMSLRAVGELRAGAATSLSSFIYLTNHSFHRPVVIIDGAPWYGHHRTAGEGDLLSRSGVIDPQLTHDGRTVDYFRIAAGIESGELGDDWLPVLNAQLAKVIALFCYVMDPEAVVVQGGPITTGSEAIADLTERFHDYSVTSSAPRIVAATQGADLTMSGALTLVLREALSVVLGAPDPPVPRFHPLTS